MTAPRDDAALLKAVRERLADEARWTQKAWCRDAEGNEPEEYLDATCWCIGGAARAEGVGYSGGGFFGLEHIAGLLGFTSEDEMFRWQDAPERTHADVIARLDTALARLSADERENGK